MPVQYYHSVFAFEIPATTLMKQTFIELQRPIIIYPLLELWYFNIQLVKLLSIPATKRLFILLALSLLFLRWQEPEEEAPLLIGSSRKWELNVPGLLSPAAEERSVWTPPGALRNLSPQPVPLVYAFQEAAKFLYIDFPVPWGSTGVEETPVSTNDGMNFSCEKGALVFFRKLQKELFCWRFLGSGPTKVEERAAGAKNILCIHPAQT